MKTIDTLREIRRNLIKMKDNKQLLEESYHDIPDCIKSFNAGIDCCIDEIDDYIEILNNIQEEKSSNSAWDFHWDGRGDYEESRRCFYGDFS
jgi:hypothetical protein